MNGKMKINTIQPAFIPPWMSVRRKISEKIAMKTQIARNKKKTSIDQSRKSPRLFIWFGSNLRVTVVTSV